LQRAKFGLFSMLLLACIFIIVFYDVFVSKIIARPISLLRDGAMQFAKGNLQKKIELQSKDEIGQLADSLNQMAIELQKLGEAEKKAAIAGMEKERAAELEKTNKELEEFHDLAVGRELKMKAMQEEIESLKRKLNDG